MEKYHLKDKRLTALCKEPLHLADLSTAVLRADAEDSRKGFADIWSHLEGEAQHDALVQVLASRYGRATIQLENLSGQAFMAWAAELGLEVTPGCMRWELVYAVADTRDQQRSH